ncbi:hypothetical protein LO771_10455 [Streptacidiphilus sp. ASG 303]|uniref:hypothetical protein n=1 Tax=Streptacidiphilus sp. ASG 303 TaxID=2896847 RepID=UPI001E585E9D|nr:hypothetical protein [Streptacidiphilus sp. ASG 303]MCD0482808.1 hypothetical protein [Streptacidiphilus sp. ASG 303]
MHGTRAEGRPPAPAQGCGWYLLAPVVAAFGVYGGTVWTVRSWAGCPLGNDAGGTVGLQMTMSAVWLCTTLVLLLFQLALRRWPPRGGRAVLWLAPVAAGVGLALLYRWGMGWPYQPPGGPCTEGYPLFPFTGTTGPHSAG